MNVWEGVEIFFCAGEGVGFFSGDGVEKMFFAMLESVDRMIFLNAGEGVEIMLFQMLETVSREYFVDAGEREERMLSFLNWRGFHENDILNECWRGCRESGLFLHVFSSW